MNGNTLTGSRVSNTWIHAVPPAHSLYWRRVRQRAFELGSDGCTCVSELFKESCLEHDIHWRTSKTIDGHDITTAQANTRFRLVIQSRSRFGRFSPISWIRYAGVSLGGRFLKHESV